MQGHLYAEERCTPGLETRVKHFMNSATWRDIRAMRLKSATEVERWFFIWDMLFPGEARPATASKYTPAFLRLSRKVQQDMAGVLRQG